MSVSLTIFVGLDYHQGTIQVCVMNKQGKVLRNRACVNDWKAVRRIVGARGRPVRVAIEACCGAAHLAQELAENAGWSVSLAHPGYVARIKQSPDKTDFSDAQLLADLIRVGYLPTVWLPPEQIRELRRLVRFRGQLVDERRRVKLRIRGLLRDSRVPAPEARAWTRAWLRWVGQEAEFSPSSRWIIQRHLARLEQLGGEIREVEKELDQWAEGDAVCRKLRRLAGIGLITAVTLRAEIGRFDRFSSGKKLSRFCGLSPRNVSSGPRQSDSGLIKAGNPQLRCILIEAAQRLMRHEPRWQQLARALGRRGKPWNVIVAAVANRWVRWLHHEMQPSRLAA
jgi:transposase